MDNKRQNTPTLNVSQSTVDILDRGNLGMNEEVFYIFRKLETIGTGIYLVADKIKDNDIIKDRIKAKSCDLIEQVGNFTEISKTLMDHVTTKSLLRNVLSQAVSIHVFLKTAFLSGLISPMNFNLLQEHLVETIKYIETVLSTLEEQALTTALPPDFFVVASPSHGHKGHSIGHNMSYKNKGHTPFPTGHAQPQTKRTHSDIKDTQNNRQKAIIGMLHKKTNLTVKDFLEVITDCSEKTIQRELIKMVDTGVLMRVGERRWSRYSLTI